MPRASSAVLICGLIAVMIPVPDGRCGEPPPNDPQFDLQWGLQNTGQLIEGHTGANGADVDALGAWAIHGGTDSVLVAIVGRGIDPHPEFGDRLLEGRSFVGDPYNTLDSCPHDTHLAGIIAAARGNGLGIAGLNGWARLLPVRVLDGCGGTEADTAEGIIWAADQGAQVILVPVQFYVGSDALSDAVAYAAANDAVVVAPVGSTGSGKIAFPAAFDDCLAVAATTNDDGVSDASNFGAAVDVAAPGRDIRSTWIGGALSYQPAGRDTASASAFVAGVAALVRSYAPQLSASEVARILIDSCDDIGKAGWDVHSGAGRINARRALELATPPPLRFEHVDPYPAQFAPEATTSWTVRIADGSETLSLGTARLYHRVPPDTFESTPLSALGGRMFRAELPAASCGAHVQYYLEAAGDSGSIVTDPANAPMEIYAGRAVVQQTLFHDDFETDSGWDVQGGTNTTGRWERVIPVGTVVQPGFDRSPDAGRYCYVTGQHPGGINPGANDVDGGPVILTSPVIDLPPVNEEVEIAYARWFGWSGVGVEDFLSVEFSRDGGATWSLVEQVASTPEWVSVSFRLSDYRAAVGDQLRVRFSTSDDPSDSLTEAGVDEVQVWVSLCSFLPGDTNGDLVVDLLDYRRLHMCLEGPQAVRDPMGCVTADLNSDFRVDLSDVAMFQGLFDP